MWRRLKRSGRGGDQAEADGAGVTALAERPVIERPTEVDDDFPGTDQELQAEIDRLAAASPAGTDPETDREVLRLRHLAGIRVLVASGGRPEHPAPDAAALPGTDGLPAVAASDLTPGLIRAGILRDGCLMVRGLIDRDRAERFAQEIDRSFAERERALEGQDPAPGYYEEFEGHPPYGAGLEARGWIREGGGVLAVDTPRLAAEMIEMFRAAGLPQLVQGYLGETPLISLEKTTLRKADPSVGGAWHQDGAFMGDVRALNLWLSLSRCGDESPGLDLVPRRLDGLVTSGTDEAVLDYQVSQAKAEEAARPGEIVRPIFEPGDALLFDELFLHATGSDPAMPKPRYAIESWFFGGSAFPGEYGPLAV
jgi:hypothetical protein